jgi:hypothetical protein
VSDLPSQIQAAFDHLRKPLPANPDGKDWARRVVARYQRNESTAAATLKLACDALHIPCPPPKENPHGRR